MYKKPRSAICRVFMILFFPAMTLWITACTVDPLNPPTGDGKVDRFSIAVDLPFVRLDQGLEQMKDGPQNCTAETNAAFCARYGKNCDSFTNLDNCGVSRTASCGTCSTPGDSCGGSSVSNVCGQENCVVETDAAFCARYGKNCDSFTNLDNCGVSRTASCGTCTTSGDTCGGGGVNNVCGHPVCIAESDAAFCARYSKNCDPFTNLDNCGVSRSANCGSCLATETCASGVCVEKCVADCNSDPGCRSAAPGNSIVNTAGTCCGTETCYQCDNGYEWDGGNCVETCVPDCSGKSCGDDGCQGTCAPGCGAGFICSEGDGQCVTEGTILFAATLKTTGNLGGRSGANTFCVNHKPLDLSCANIKAFVCVGATDELRDMPINYGFASNAPVYWYHATAHSLTKFANNWPDMFDNAIEVNARTGTGIYDDYWTGSYVDGSEEEPRDPGYGNCSGWNSTSTYGTVGANLNTNFNWLYNSGKLTCTHTQYLLCACK